MYANVVLRYFYICQRHLNEFFLHYIKIYKIVHIYFNELRQLCIYIHICMHFINFVLHVIGVNKHCSSRNWRE